MTAGIEALVIKARRSLAVAQRLVEQGDYDFGVSRASYAMFYLATAMLASRRKAFSKHSGVIAGFGQQFVLTGQFPSEHHAALHEAFELRGVADYRVEPTITEAEARALLDRAARFISDAEAWLRRTCG